MFSAISIVKCAYPGCGKHFGRSPRRQFCTEHSQLLLEVATRQKLSAPVPVPPPPTPPPAPPPPVTPPPESSGKASSGGGVTTTRRTQNRHRDSLEAAKRKFAKRAKPL